MKKIILIFSISLCLIYCSTEEIEFTHNSESKVTTKLSSLGITSLILIDAETDTELFPIGESTILDLSKLPKSLNIKALTTDNVRSVKFELRTSSSFIKIENTKPYALFGDNPRGDFNGGLLAPNSDGDNIIIVTPFAGRNATGQSGTSLRLNLNFINQNSSQLKITSLFLVDADNNDILFPIGESTLIDLSRLPQNLSIKANTSPDQVGSVVFELDAIPNFRNIENTAPYLLFGDSPRGNFIGGNLPLSSTANGNNIISVTPYSSRNGEGTKGETSRIQLNVIN
ncbi:hypothetical protein [Aquimarina litoralis]